MLFRRFLGSLVCCGALAGTALAQQERLSVDPATSQVHFTLVDPLHTVHGTFKIQQGGISFNRADGSMQGGIAVDAASGTSGDSSRDKKMTLNQMEAPKFSTVTFMPQHFSGRLASSGDSIINIDGTFTLLGKPHWITVPMKVHIQGSVFAATGSFTVPYVQWGMKDPSLLVLRVAKQVVVDLDISGTIAP